LLIIFCDITLVTHILEEKTMIARSALLALSWGIFSVAPVSAGFAPPQYLPIYGGSGGTSFTRDCGSGYVLTGLRYRGGLLVDAVGLLCRPVSASGTLGSESTVGTLAGGGGGTAGTAICPTGTVVSSAEIKYGTYVNRVRIRCRPWNAAERTFGGTTQFPSDQVGETGSIVAGQATVKEEKCEAYSQPARGIRGRAHSLVDAIGFICNEP
jgi:hypothetical protein